MKDPYSDKIKWKCHRYERSIKPDSTSFVRPLAQRTSLTNSSQKYKHIATIRNDLKSLIPLGVLHLVNLPSQSTPSMEALDGWSWLDFSWIDHHGENNNDMAAVKSLVNMKANYKFSRIFQDLAYLFQRLYTVATYKTVRINDQINVTVIRVYAIPCDVEGNRYLEQARTMYLRRGKGQAWHDKMYQSAIKRIIGILDYNEDRWLVKDHLDLRGSSSSSLLIFSGVAEMDGAFRRSDDFFDKQDLNHHIGRLLRNRVFTPSPIHSEEETEKNDDLDVRLTEVYNSIHFQIDSNSEYLQSVIRIKGLKSSLYNYQKESIAKMLHHESPLKNNHIPLPYFHQIEKLGHAYHFNSHTLRFSSNPEYYNAPRGGILAENMGLGKTLICLALVCYTKNEVAYIPDELIQGEVKDYRVKSLQEQCIRAINRLSIPWRGHKDALPESCIKLLNSNPGFYYHKKDCEGSLVPNRRMLSRDRPMIQQEKILLTHGTLIVVPDNLFSQWVQEITKHIEDNYLEILIVDSRTSSLIAKPFELITYDLILMSHSIYTSQNPITSPLFKIHWKRLIIDEGHSLTHRTTKIVDLSSQLQVERKWAVTGTPTHGMTNLQLTENERDKVTVSKKFKPREDLTRLGHLIMHFFKLQPWCLDTSIWSRGIVRPFVQQHPGGVTSLKSLLTELLVRHSTDDIEKDVNLPPLYHTPIYLEPSHHNSVSVNLFTAVLAINAISSERTDQDYMFHPGNKSDLRRLVSNLQRSSFYWTGFSVNDLETMITISQACLDKKANDGVSDYFNGNDKILLQRSIAVCQDALKDQTWRIVSTIHEMCFYIDGLDNIYYQRYGIGSANDSISGPNSSVFGAPQLYELQQFYFKNRFAGKSLMKKLDDGSKDFWKSYWKDVVQKNKDRVKKNDGQPVELVLVSEELDYQDSKRNNIMKMKRHNDVKYDDPNIVKDAKTGRIQTSLATNSEANKDLDPLSSLNAVIQGTASAKLSYMVTQLLNNKICGIKSIIFYEFEDMAYYLSESLDLLGLPYLLYSTSVPLSQRAERISQFTETEGSCTLIMDLKLASHGLTIISATKVYFLCPVWKRSMEAQAIKRAHRIGQTQPVHVETLILKGSLEEEMFRQRRHGTTDQSVATASDKEFTGVVEDNEQVREHILKFQFLEESSKAANAFSAFECDFPSNGKFVISDKNVKLEEYELPEPYCKLGNNHRLTWITPLFNKDTQFKMSQLSSKVSKYVKSPLHASPSKPKTKGKGKVPFDQPSVIVDKTKITVKLKRKRPPSEDEKQKKDKRGGEEDYGDQDHDAHMDGSRSVKRIKFV